MSETIKQVVVWKASDALNCICPHCKRRFANVEQSNNGFKSELGFTTQLVGHCEHCGVYPLAVERYINESLELPDLDPRVYTDEEFQKLPAPEPLMGEAWGSGQALLIGAWTNVGKTLAGLYIDKRLLRQTGEPIFQGPGGEEGGHFSTYVKPIDEGNIVWLLPDRPINWRDRRDAVLGRKPIDRLRLIPHEELIKLDLRNEPESLIGASRGDP